MNTAFETKDNKDEWLTPPYITAALGHFDLDPCAPISPPWRIADWNLNILDDGLAQDWSKWNFVWCNPPYGRETGKWLEKMKRHNNGIALIFARTDTRMFQDHVFTADAILFLKGRLSFYDVTGKKGGTAGAPSCLVAYGPEAVGRLTQCGLPGKLVVL
jgi:hypothetical protein